MDSLTHFADMWLRRIIREMLLIFIPGLMALILIDVNFGIFRGEFSLTDLVNFNTLVVYYVDKLDLMGEQHIPYAAVFLMIIYILGYFLHSSSKYFVGPKRFRIFLNVKDAEDELHMPVPPAAAAFLNAKDGNVPADAGAEVCQALIDTSGIPSQVSSYENRSGFYRSMGYLFSLLALLNICLFLVAFDFDATLLKVCIAIFNVVFAFLFFKGQEETSHRWKEQLSAETLVAIKQLSK